MYRIEVDTQKKKLRLFDDDTLAGEYPVAVGKPSTPTPKGNWTITRKALWGAQFGGHFMQLSIPQGIYGIHGTNKPWTIGSAVSHGCIRMYSRDAAELYQKVPVGTQVHVY